MRHPAPLAIPVPTHTSWGSTRSSDQPKVPFGSISITPPAVFQLPRAPAAPCACPTALEEPPTPAIARSSSGLSEGRGKEQGRGCDHSKPPVPRRCPHCFPPQESSHKAPTKAAAGTAGMSCSPRSPAWLSCCCTCWLWLRLLAAPALGGSCRHSQHSLPCREEDEEPARTWPLLGRSA